MSRIDELIAIMAALRDPATGCPWDREQSFATIAPYTLEEAYEVADAIDRGDLEGLRDELGDLLFQVVYHARMAEEAGAFAFADVVAGICAKMVRRHPHVFGEAEVASADAQSEAWEAHKEAERRARAAGAPGASLLDDVGRALPALMRAQKLQRRAARVGFDWPDAGGVRAKLAEELAELEGAVAQSDGERVAAEVGDVLFTAVNLARHLGVDAEEALRGASGRFERRFREMERMADADLAALSPEAREALWARAKARRSG
jgi:ATP diphosphatase